MNKTFVNIIGWYGALAIMTAYILVSFSLISAESFLFQILNATGAIGVAVISLYDKAYQPAILNIVWALVALIALINMFL